MTKKKKEYKQIKINISVEDYKKLSIESENQAVTRAEYIRQKMQIDFEEKRLPQGKIFQKKNNVDLKFLYELNKIGVNINQISKHTNIENSVDIEVLKSLLKIEKKINEIYEIEKRKNKC